MKFLPKYSSILAGCSLIFSVSSASAGENVVMATPATITWRLSGGLMARNVKGADFSVGSITGSSALPTPFGNGYYHLPTSVGDQNTNADRAYDDGYVNRDLVVPNDAYTPYWGYNNGSQYSGGFGGTLTMNVDPSSNLAGSSRYVSGSSHSANVNASGSDETELGFRVEFDRMTSRDGGWSTGPVVGCSIFSGGSSVGGVSSFSGMAHADDYKVGVKDVYQLDSQVKAPSASYTHNGQGPGPLIKNQPSSRTPSEEFDRSHDTAFYSQAELELDFFVVSFDLGYKVEHKWDRFSVNGSTGASINIVPWDAKHSEAGFQSTVGGPTTSYSSASVDNDGTSFLLGAYFQGGMAYDITETLSLGGFGRYDFTQSFDDEIGASSFDQDLSGWSAGVMLTKRF